VAGDALGGAKGEYVSAERNRLETLRLLALQDRIALDLELARHAEVLPEAGQTSHALWAALRFPDRSYSCC
jgi:hypothetical protein